MVNAWKAIGDAVVSRSQLVWWLVALHVVLIGVPAIAFASRGYSTGWEELAWIAIGIEVGGARQATWIGENA